MTEGRLWIYEDGEIREPTADDLAEIEFAKKHPRRNFKAGDNVFVTIPAEHFSNFLAADKISDEFALAVGKAFFQWTSCCDEIFSIFVELSRIEEPIARAVFNRIRSDKAQRDLTLDVAKHRLSSMPDLLSELKVTLRELENLASERNVFAHVLFGIHFDKEWNARMKPKAAPKNWNGDKHPNKAAEQLGIELHACAKRLFALRVKLS